MPKSITLGTATPSLTPTSTPGGTYSATPPGLSLNPATGIINLNASVPGTYTVQYTVTGGNGCTAISTIQVTITQAPIVTIFYAGSPYCKNLVGPQSVTFSGTPGSLGGVYSSTPGLTLNSANGDVTPSSSTAGTYTVTYTSPVVNGCSSQAFASVTITNTPTATINYPGAPR